MTAHTQTIRFGAIVLLAGLSAIAVAQDARKPVIKSGEHFRVASHLPQEAIADQILEWVETAWQVEAEVFGGRSELPPELREMNLYPSASAYQAVEKKLTAGRFKDNLAFSHWDTFSAHVALQPPVPAKVLDKYGLPLLTARLLIHEAAHVARYSMIPNHQSHPRWLEDGIASRVEELVLLKYQLCALPESDPFFSTQMVLTVRLISENRLPTVGEILRDNFSKLSNGESYAVRWLWVRFLSEKHAAAWKQIADIARRLGGGSGYAATLATEVEKILATSAVNADKGFRDYLGQLKPQWEEVLRSLAVEGSIWRQSAFTESNAIAWQTAEVGKDSYSIAGQVNIFPNAKQQMNLLLGRSPNGFVSVSFVAGFGITVFHYDAQANQWNKLNEVKSGQVVPGKWLDFQALIKGNTLQIKVNEEEVITVSGITHPLTGSWGVGTQAGAGGMWNEVKWQ